LIHFGKIHWDQFIWLQDRTFALVLTNVPINVPALYHWVLDHWTLNITVKSRSKFVIMVFWPRILLNYHMLWGDVVTSYLYLMHVVAQLITKGRFSHNYVQIVRHHSTHVYLCLLQKRRRRRLQPAQVSCVIWLRAKPELSDDSTYLSATQITINYRHVMSPEILRADMTSLTRRQWNYLCSK